MSAPPLQPKSDLQARLLGLGFAAAGAALLWWQVAGTIRQAREGVPEVQYSITAILLGLMFVAMGLVGTVGGNASYAWVRRVTSEPKLRRFLTLCVAALGIAIFLGLMWLFRRLGYS